MELLHGLAVAPAALGTCCLAVDGAHRRRAVEVGASVLMTLAMLDAALLHVLAPVWWAAALGLVALVLAARSRVRAGARRSAAATADTRMAAHVGLGLVGMAALLAVMSAPTAGVVTHHGAGTYHGVGALAPWIAALVLLHGAVSLVWALRARSLARAQHLGMGLAALLMALAALA